MSSDQIIKKAGIRQACEEKIRAERDSLKRDRSSGTTVLGYACHAFPAGIAAGLGMRPVRLLCGTGADSESAGEQLVRPDVCPLVKTLLGNIKNRCGLHGNIDLWAGLSTCDQMRRGMEVLAARLEQKVYPIHVPATRTKESADYFTQQIRRFVVNAEARSGRPFDAEQADRWQRERDRASSVLSRAARSGFVSPLDLHALFHLLFVGRPEGLADFFEEVLASASRYQPVRTVLLAGSPLGLEDTVLLEALEQRGYGILPLNCTGLNTVEDGRADIPAKDIIELLALRAFHLPHCARNRPNSPVYERIREALQVSRGAGLIVKCLKFCDHWYTERERMRRSFDLPVLVYDSDYSNGGRERLTTRIDAFLETLG